MITRLTAVSSQLLTVRRDPPVSAADQGFSIYSAGFGPARPEGVPRLTAAQRHADNGEEQVTW
jgi:hypothetical protein